MLRALAAIALVAAVTACAKTQPRHQTIVLSDLVGRGTSIAETLKECDDVWGMDGSLIALCTDRRVFSHFAAKGPYRETSAKVEVSAAMSRWRTGMATERGMDSRISTSPLIVPHGWGAVLRMPDQQGLPFRAIAIYRTASGSAVTICGGKASAESDCLHFIAQMSAQPETVFRALADSIEAYAAAPQK